MKELIEKLEELKNYSENGITPVQIHYNAAIDDAISVIISYSGWEKWPDLIKNKCYNHWKNKLPLPALTIIQWLKELSAPPEDE